MLVGSTEKWPSRKGANGQHPAVVALEADWATMIEIIKCRHAEEGPARGTIAIAAEVLAERHPGVWGWAHPLGWAATE